MVDLAVELYKSIIVTAVPVAFIFEIGNLAVSTLLRVAFGGKLWFGR